MEIIMEKTRRPCSVVDFYKNEIMKQQNISDDEAMRVLQCDKGQWSRFLKGDTLEVHWLIDRIAETTQTSSDMWRKMQSNHDEWVNSQ